jgi:hypothetical protein
MQPYPKDSFILMISHSVFFWLKPNVPVDTQGKLLQRAREDLAKIEGVQNLLVGRPLPTDRKVVDSSYQVGLSMSFSSVAELSRYQNDAVHQQFVNEWVKPFVDKTVVYDFEQEN